MTEHGDAKAAMMAYQRGSEVRALREKLDEAVEACRAQRDANVELTKKIGRLNKRINELTRGAEHEPEV